MPIEGSNARSAASYLGARRPEAIKLAKQKRREMRDKLLRERSGEPPRPDKFRRNREMARRRRQMAAGQLQR